MQSTVVEPKKTVEEEIGAAPGIAGKEIVKGAEVVGNDLEKGVVDLGTALVNVTKAAATEITRAGSRIDGAGQQAPNVRTESLKPVTLVASLRLTDAGQQAPNVRTESLKPVTLGASTATAPGVPPVVTPATAPPAPAVPVTTPTE